MLTPPPLSKTTSLAAFANTLSALGVPIESALNRAKLPIYYQERPDAWISYRAMRRFVGSICEREALDNLGMRTTQRSSEQGVHPTLLHAVYSAPTLFNAMGVIAKMARVQSSQLRIWTESHADTTRLCIAHPLGPDFPGYEPVESFTTRLLVLMLQHFCGPSWLPARVYSRYSKPRCRQAELVTPFAELGVPGSPHDHYAAIDIPNDELWKQSFHRARADEALAPLDSGTSVKEMLRCCLAPYLPEGMPTLELAAEIMNTSPRKLQRTLLSENTTFREVVTRARLDYALRDLADFDVPLAVISTRLGYSEQSAFSRAFKAWVGVSPRGYRAGLRSH